MKKFIFTSIALLSAMGLQAAVTLTNGNVTYSCEQTNVSEGTPTDSIISEQLTTSNVTSSGSLALTIENGESQTNTYTYNGTVTGADGTNIDLKNFSQTVENASITTSGSTNLDSATYYTTDSAKYATYLSEAANINSNILTYDQISSYSNENSYYYYFTYSTRSGWNKKECTSLAEFQGDYTNYENVYYWKNTTTVSGTEYTDFYAICQIAVASRTTTSINKINNVKVVAIADDAFVDDDDIQGVTIGKNITGINPAAFKGASNYTLSLQDNSYAYTYSNGILYNSSKTEIVLASTGVETQTLNNSVTTIDDYAFYNTANTISITTKNSSISVDESTQGSNVTFCYPSSTLNIVATSNGGYKVTGSIVDANMDTLNIKGTYMDFTDATILESLSFTNNDSTLLYFNTDAIVDGGKNVINGGVCANFAITDKKTFYCPTSFTATSATYTRTFTTTWGTLCLPFSVDDLSNNLRLGALSEFSNNVFTFSVSDGITANKPYLVRAIDGEYTIISASNVTVAASGTSFVTKNNATFTGVYEAITVNSDESTYYYGVGTKDGVTSIYKFNNVKVNPFRAYISLPYTSLSAAKFRFVDAFENEIESFDVDVTTGIENIKSTNNSDNVYNLNGQSLNKATRGLNIVNGKLVINK
ncbi:MAG: leucine-rich repeat protein [Bacteroidales bacterium]|nr:leucine-rich repeat protein [Bacteroidales bacterium]